MQEFKLGLGWDTRMDLDASLLLMDDKGNIVETIYFGNLKSKNGCIVHSGDNLTGDGDGDDEVITVNMINVPENVTSIWPVVTIYSSDKQFDDVKGAYCRIVSKGSELCRYDLSDNMDNVSNGNIVANFKRVGETWSFKALGYYTKNTSCPRDMAPIIKEIHQNNFKNIKIIKKIYYNTTPSDQVFNLLLN